MFHVGDIISRKGIEEGVVIKGLDRGRIVRLYWKNHRNPATSDYCIEDDLTYKAMSEAGWKIVKRAYNYYKYEI